MSQVISDDKKLEQLIKYYKESGLLIVGLNDSQGVNTTPTFFRKGLLEYLASALTSDELTPTVINAFSLTMNKTEHIDYFLKHNLSLEEIKLSQVYSAVSALEKVMQDIGMPRFLGKVGNLYKIIYRLKDGDENIHITSSLKYAHEPVMIYSSGVNNLMREVGNNPGRIGKDYRRREKYPNYDYTLKKAQDPNTLRNVMDSIEKNFENILEINHHTDIYTLGAYIPKPLQQEGMNVFRELVIAYNEKLKDLCEQYDTTFIDTGEVGNQCNFHVSTAGHNTLANYILGYMYYNKIELKDGDALVSDYKGAMGVAEEAFIDYNQSYAKAMTLSGYDQKRELQIADEHKREGKIFQKVIKKSR